MSDLGTGDTTGMQNPIFKIMGSQATGQNPQGMGQNPMNLNPNSMNPPQMGMNQGMGNSMAMNQGMNQGMNQMPGMNQMQGMDMNNQQQMGNQMGNPMGNTMDPMQTGNNNPMMSQSGMGNNMGMMGQQSQFGSPMNPQMGQMGQMNPQMGQMGQMNPQMGQTGQMNPQMGQMGQMNPQMTQMGQMNPGMMGNNGMDMQQQMMQQQMMQQQMMQQQMMQQQMMQQQMMQQQMMAAQQQQAAMNNILNQSGGQGTGQANATPANQMASSAPSQGGGFSVIFRASGATGQASAPIMVQCMPDEKVSEVTEKYRSKSGDRDQTKKFIFNAKNLAPSLSVAEAGITNNANIFVVATKGIKGAF